MTPKQLRVLKHHRKSKFYDRNGTGEPKLIIKRVVVPCDRQGRPLLMLLCAWSEKDKYGRFEYCVYTDLLLGKNHVPSDKFGFGTKKQALADFKEQIFKSMTGVWSWVINEAWKKTYKILEQK